LPRRLRFSLVFSDSRNIQVLPPLVWFVGPASCSSNMIVWTVFSSKQVAAPFLSAAYNAFFFLCFVRSFFFSSPMSSFPPVLLAYPRFGFAGPPPHHFPLFQPRGGWPCQVIDVLNGAFLPFRVGFFLFPRLPEGSFILRPLGSAAARLS